MFPIIPPARSSWIRLLVWESRTEGIFASLMTVSRKAYRYKISYRDLADWIGANSKGRFYNQRVKGKRCRVRAFST